MIKDVNNMYVFKSETTNKKYKTDDLAKFFMEHFFNDLDFDIKEAYEVLTDNAKIKARNEDDEHNQMYGAVYDTVNDKDTASQIELIENWSGSENLYLLETDDKVTVKVNGKPLEGVWKFDDGDFLWSYLDENADEFGIKTENEQKEWSAFEEKGIEDLLDSMKYWGFISSFEVSEAE